MRRNAVRTSSPRFAIGAVFARCSGCSARWLACIGAANVPIAIVTDVRRNAVRTSSPRFAIRTLEVCHGDKVCPRAAAVRAVLDVAVRHAQVHAASTAACPRRLVDRRHQRVLCLRRQAGKVADLTLDRLQRNLVCRCVYIPGGLRALMDRKIHLHLGISARVIGDVGVGRQRVPILKQLIRDDGRAVVPDIHVHAAAKASILIVDLFDAVAVGDLDPPPGVPLPQRPASVCDCYSHAVTSFTCIYPLRGS